MNRREQAIEAAARARYEQAANDQHTTYGGGPVPKWDGLAEMYRDGWRRGLAPIVDAVLAVPCDCAGSVGICGDQEESSGAACVLRAGHSGGHHGDDGSDWTHGDEHRASVHVRPPCDCAERLDAEAERLRKGALAAVMRDQLALARVLGDRADTREFAALFLRGES